MNHDEQKPDLQTWIDPELEARVVAAVLGEASAFETAELERLVGEKPELGIFKRRIEAVHGLVGQATRPEQAPLRLAPERRAKILQAIGATAARPTEGDRNAPILLQLAAARHKRRVRFFQTYGLAASLALAAIVIIALQPSGEVRLAHQKRAESTVQHVELPMAALAAPEADELEDREQATFAAPPQLVAPAMRATGLGAGVEHFSPPGIGGLAAQLPTVDHYIAPAGKKRERNLALTKPTDEARTFGYTGLDATRRPTQLQDSASAVTTLSGDFATQAARRKGVVGGAAGSARFEGAKQVRDANAAEPSSGTFEEPVVLSPFSVTADADMGYRASNTLAGSRVSTGIDLSAVGADLRSRSNGFAGIAGGLAQRQAGDVASFDFNDGFLATTGATSAKRAALPAAAAPVESAAAIDARLSANKSAETPVAPTSAEDPTLEVSTARQPVSTFSLHVSDVSFKFAQAALARNELPDPARIRPEEFYNAFDYGDPSPASAEKIGCRIEQSAHPLLQQRNLVRIAMKVPAAGRGAGQPLRLTVLLDTSGSMERQDRTATVRSALSVLGSLLGSADRVTLIGFARQPRLLAEQLAGDQAGKLAELASATPFTGGTNLEEALKLAGEIARRHQDAEAQNRIVLITDGAANLGNADPAQLAMLVERLRQEGIAFDACGVGTDGLDDAVLEALTRKGDGRYYLLDSPEHADAGFARQLAGAFRPAAENVKVQVRFNPARVASYRLIGFEQHRLREEDFRNDQVDAAELAAEEAAVALYQVEVLPQGEGELGDVFARFRDAATGLMIERSWTILHDPNAPAFDRASPSMQLAGTAALLAEKLRGGERGRLIELGELAPVVNALRGHYAHNTRVQELVTMFEQLRRIAQR